MPDAALLKGKSIEKRIRVLTKYARKVDCKSKAGLSEEEGLEFVRYWRPAFGSLKLLRSQPDANGRRELKLAVDSYVCHKCRFAFDEKDLKSICADGIMCPKCGELFAKDLAALSRESQPSTEPKQAAGPEPAERGEQK